MWGSGQAKWENCKNEISAYIAVYLLTKEPINAHDMLDEAHNTHSYRKYIYTSTIEVIKLFHAESKYTDLRKNVCTIFVLLKFVENAFSTV